MAPVNRIRAGIYVRISQDREGGGLGVQRQEGDCRALGEDIDWDVVDVYIDNDLSAFGAKVRPDYERLLTDLESGRINAVLSWHTDRLHKKPMELERYIDVCGPRSAPTRTVKAGELDLSTPSGRMVARIFGATARAESERIGERVAAARAQARAAGRPNGGIRPFGYEADGTAVRETEAAEIEKATAAILGGGSLRGIVLDWNRRGVLTTTGRTWSSRTVRDVLLRHRNAGLVAHKGEVVGKAAWPAIVGEDQRTRVEQLLTDPARRTSPSNVVKYLGSYLYVCGVCQEQRMVVSANGGSRPGHAKRRNAYRCRSSDEGGDRHLVRDQAKVDELVVETILARFERGDIRRLVAASKAEEVDTTAIVDELGAIRERRAWMVDAGADGDMTEDECRTGLRRLTTRAGELEAQLASAPTSSPLAVMATADDARARWEEQDLGTQRAIINTLVVVTLLPAQRSGPKFDPMTVNIERRI